MVLVLSEWNAEVNDNEHGSMNRALLGHLNRKCQLDLNQFHTAHSKTNKRTLRLLELKFVVASWTKTVARVLQRKKHYQNIRDMLLMSWEHQMQSDSELLNLINMSNGCTIYTTSKYAWKWIPEITWDFENSSGHPGVFFRVEAHVISIGCLIANYKRLAGLYYLSHNGRVTVVLSSII